MAVYKYRELHPTDEAQNAFVAWLRALDEKFTRVTDADGRSDIVRDELALIYYGKSYSQLVRDTDAPAALAAVSSLDPRNATLEPEYYGDIDGERFAPRKPLIWFWMMYDRSPLGLNHWLGFRFRYMIAKHVLKHVGKNVKIFHGVEVSYGYNLVIEDDCVIHKYVLLDDRGGIIVHQGSSISDYANVYSHSHDLNEAADISNEQTEIGPKARITYHATVMSGVKIGEHALVGSMGVATKDVPPYNISVGIPSRTVKVKTIAPEHARKSFEKR